MPDQEMATLEHNPELLCNPFFESSKEQGISFNEAGKEYLKEYLNVICDAVVNGIDESDFSDAEFDPAIDLTFVLVESLRSSLFGGKIAIPLQVEPPHAESGFFHQTTICR